MSVAGTPLPPRRGRLDGLEAGRGVAAAFVLVCHSSLIIAEPRFYGATVWGGGLAAFGAGVDFFFVLSGFIIAWAHARDVGRPDQLKRYAFRRFKRIYPPYWGVLLPLSLLYFLTPGSGVPSQHDPVNFVISFFLLPYPLPPILGVAWTLVYEMIFYIVFALVIVKGRAAYWVLGGWGAAAFIANLVTPQLPFPISVFLNAHNLQFLLGIVAATILRRGRVPAATPLAVLGTLAFVALIVMPWPVRNDPLWGRVGYGLAAMAFILGIVERERSQGLAVPWVLRQLGAASYSIYLIHGVAISFGIQLLTRLFPRSLPLAVAMVILVTLGLLAGIVYHHLVEKRLTGWLERFAPARPVSSDSVDAPETTAWQEGRRVG